MPTSLLARPTDFGACLRLLRRRARLTQRDLGIATGYATSQICRFERGARPPELTTLIALFVPALQLDQHVNDVALLLERAAAARGEDLHGLQLDSRTLSLSDGLPVVPAPSTALVGRAADLAQLRAMLAGGARLLTLSGPPGVGKSRLALELLREQPAGVDGHTAFIPLAPLKRAEHVADAVAAALRIEPRQGQAASDAVANWLRDKRALLVLDNFEHLLEAAPLLFDWLSRAPELTLLVTSRAVLRLSGEHEYVLSPLQLPAIAPMPALSELRDMPAVRLFMQRAQAVNSALELNSHNALSVVALCVHLDGLPLALELAAARCRVLSPGALLAELVSDERARLKLLTRNTRDVGERHSSLRAAIAWSVSRLEAGPRAVFASLSVLPADSPLDAAQSVTGAALDDLEALRENSLLRIEQQGGETRVSMLESIRDYGRELLADETGPWQRMLDWCQALCGPVYRWHEHLESRTPASLARFQRERHVLDAGLAWCVAHDVVRGLQLACAASYDWYRSGDYVLGRNWLRCFAAPPAKDDLVLAAALHNLGLLEERCGSFQASLPHLQRAQAIYAALDQPLDAALVGVRIADIYCIPIGDPEQAERLCRDALPVLIDDGDQTMLSWIYSVLARACDGRAARADVEALVDRSVEHALLCSDRHTQTWIIGIAGDFDITFGHPDRAVERLMQCARLARKHDYRAAEVYAWIRLLSLYRLRDERAAGLAAVDAALDVAGRCQVSGYVAQLAALVALWLMAGQPDQSRLALLGRSLRASAHLYERLLVDDAQSLRSWHDTCVARHGAMLVQQWMHVDDSGDYDQLLAAVRQALAPSTPPEISSL